MRKYQSGLSLCVAVLQLCFAIEQRISELMNAFGNLCLVIKLLFLNNYK